MIARFVESKRWVTCALYLCAFWMLGIVAAADDTATTSSEDQVPQAGFFEIVFSGGVTGFLIVMLLLCLSVSVVALVVEHLLSIRRDVLIPPGLAEDVQKYLLVGDVNGANTACRSKPSFLAFVLEAGISETDSGWGAVEKAMQEERMRRRQFLICGLGMTHIPSRNRSRCATELKTRHGLLSTMLLVVVS